MTLTIGMWWARCCLHDLQEIRTDADIREAEGERDGGQFRGPWSSLDDALRDLLPEEDEGSVETWIRYQEDVRPDVDVCEIVRRARGG